ncbi:hypothetical protein CP02DC23_1103, partial [Chlamydia psittaci 02DC23]|jgi:hypothetical protein
MIFS